MNKGSINHHKLLLSKDRSLDNLFNKKYFSSECRGKGVFNRKTFNDSLRAFPLFGLPNAKPFFIAVLKLSLVKALTPCTTAFTLGPFKRLHNKLYQLLCLFHSFNHNYKIERLKYFQLIPVNRINQISFENCQLSASEHTCLCWNSASHC